MYSVSKKDLLQQLLGAKISQSDFDKGCGISNPESVMSPGRFLPHGAIWSSEINYKSNNHKSGFSQMGRIGPNFAGVP
jgi:hypothetical protein